tara:strand:+ start:6333 stop:7682 length:1350 start_codon:yes stop_codon:yes gene_type:complete
MRNNFNYENKLSLKIIKEIDNLNIKFVQDFGKINLISIFFLEIQRYLSSSLRSKINNTYSKTNVKFPFVDLKYLNKNQKINFYKYSKIIDKKYVDDNLNELNFNKSFFLNKMLNFFTTKEKIYLPNKNIENFFKKKTNFYRKIYLHKIYLNNLDIQQNKLREFLLIFKKKNNIKNNYFIENFINWIKLFLSNKETSNNVKSDILIVGSNMNIKSRIMSATYLLNNKKVISFSHSNHNTLIYEDPVNEMGEYSFCTKYYTFGKIAFKKKYIKSDLFNPKEIISISRKVKLLKYKIKNYNKILYVPNSYNSYRRYGYYRDIDDKVYLKWQKKILSSNNSIFLKLHPKSRFSHNSLDESKLLNKNLEKYLEKFNLFIFDNISQPFFEIAKTNKKILYFDIGQRPLKNNIIKLIKKRAFVVKCNLNLISLEKIAKKIELAKKFKIKNYDILNI